MNSKYEKITMRQFDFMKHALGLDQHNAKPKRGKYTAYRNYYCTSGKNEEWEELVNIGVATSRGGDPEIYPSSVIYHVSKDGIQLMESVLGFKIIESD